MLNGMDRLRFPRALVRASAAALLLALAGAPAAFASEIGLTPPRLELTVPPGGTVTETVTLATSAQEPQQVRVSLTDWVMDYEGRLGYFPASTLPTSAASWIEPETSDVLLEPVSTREFRITVTAPATGAEGTHQAMVFFQVVPPGGDADGVGVTVTTRIALAVYVTVAGTERPAADLVDFYRDDDALTLVLANDGNTLTRLGGIVELRDETGETVAQLPVPDVPVLRESERQLRLSLPADLEAGFYIALALVEDNRGGLLVGELPLTVE